MKKKVVCLLLVIIILFGICDIVKADEKINYIRGETNLIITNPLKIFERDKAYIILENEETFCTRGYVYYDSEDDYKTVRFKDQIYNALEPNDTRVVFVLDNSRSMDTVTSSGKTRKELAYDFANNIANGLNNNIEEKWMRSLGLVVFSNDTYRAGIYKQLVENDQIFFGKLDEYKNKATSGGGERSGWFYYTGTDIKSGIEKAKDVFYSSRANNVLVLLTDGVARVDSTGNYETDEQTNLENETKEALKSLEDLDIKLVTIMPELDSNSEKYEEEKNVVQNIFGTKQSPTYGKIYSVSNTSNDIENEVLSYIESGIRDCLKNVKIEYEFTGDLIDKFEIKNVSADYGNVSQNSIEGKKTICWTMDELKGDLKDIDVDSGIFKHLNYHFYFNDVNNNDYLDKDIIINLKGKITCNDIKGNEYTNEKDFRIKFNVLQRVIKDNEEQPSGGGEEQQLKEELTATVSYDPEEETTGKVTATIKTNKKVNEVEGWTLSEDGKTLTKEYSENTIETVHLVDIDEMTKDVEIVINNIKKVEQKDDEPKKEEPKEDNTLADKPIPKAGDTFTFIVTFGIALIALITIYFKVKSYKDIK